MYTFRFLSTHMINIFGICQDKSLFFYLLRYTISKHLSTEENDPEIENNRE